MQMKAVARAGGSVAAYVKRASYFNASARTSEGCLGLIFRRSPFVKLPDASADVDQVVAQFVTEAEMLGTSPCA